jgi:ribosomal protein S18 acetylase RimI-like enzyme
MFAISTIILYSWESIHSMIFNLRKATDEDLDLTFKIKENALQEYLEMLWGWNEKAQADFHRREFKKKHFQVIELQNEAIGYLEIVPFIDHIFMANLMILQKNQGKGIGKIIMQDLIKNNPQIVLEVLKVNQRAINFYQELDFEIIDDLEVSYRMKLK